MNPSRTLVDHLLLEHSNGRNATQTSMHVQTEPSAAHEVDLNQFSKTMSSLVENLESLQQQGYAPLNVEKAT